MTIAVGDRLPDATFTLMGPEGPTQRTVAQLTAGRKVALFAVPGAFTPTCSNKHVPSFIEAADDLRAKGVDEIACVSVNDVFVMKAWGEQTGATGAGITMLSDAESAFTTALGLDFTAPPAGLIKRSQRYSMLVDDGVVKILNLENSPGDAAASLGDALVAQI